MEFGEGKAGRTARKIVENEVCVGKGCDSRDVHTLDFDTLGDLDQLPVCDEHEASVMDVVKAQMVARGQIDVVNTFSRNGLGRA